MIDYLGMLERARSDPETLGVLADALADCGDSGTILSVLKRALFLENEQSFSPGDWQNRTKNMTGMPFKTRTFNLLQELLHKMRVRHMREQVTLQDICTIHAEDLWNYYGIGRLAMWEVRELLREREMHLRGETTDRMSWRVGS